MNILRAAVAAAALTFASAGVAQAATVTSVDGATASDRALLVSGASAVPSASQVRVLENGHAVAGLRVSSAGAAALRSPVMIVVPKGRPWALAAARKLAAERTLAPGVVTYSGTDVTLAAPVGSAGASRDALAGTGVAPAGARPLDAINSAIGQLPDGGTVVVFSGAADSASTHTLEQLTAAATRAGVSIDAVAAPAARSQLASLASSTGGTVDAVALQADGTADSASALTAADQVAGRIDSGYVVSYRSTASGKVQLTAPGVSRTLSVNDDATPASVTTTAASSSGGPSVALIAAIAALVGIAIFLLLQGRPKGNDFEGRVSAWIVPPDDEDDDAAMTDENGNVQEAEGSRRSRMREALDLAGFGVSIDVFLLRAGIAAVVLAAAGFFAVGPIGAVVAAAIVPIVARQIVASATKRRRARFNGQLADTVQAVASAMRAGHGLSGAIAMVAEDSPEPVVTELNRAVSAERLGVPLDVALDEVVVRMKSRDLEQVALVAALQRDVGGNAAEALDQIVETIRARDDLRRMVNGLTAQGRLSRWVLTCLPIGLAGVTSVMTKGYMDPMIHGSGLMISIGAGISVVIGSWLIGRIVDINV